MATVEKIRKDIEKTKEKISAQQKRLRELEAQLTEEENLEIVRMVKAVRMDNKELTAFLKLCKGCVHPCKQSFRAVVVSCPHYLSLRSQKCRN